MKVYGSWKEQVDAQFRTSGDNKVLTLAIPASLTGASLTLTLPDVSGISDNLVSDTSVSTLTNKTLTLPIISQISNTGTLTLPTDTDTLVGRQTTDILTNKSINADTNTITNIDNNEIKAAAGIALDKLAPLSANLVPVSDASGFLVDSIVSTTELEKLDTAGTNAADELVKTDSSQTLSNKTLDNSNVITVQDSNITIQDNIDNTKQLNLQLSGITTATTQTLTIPDASGTIVLNDNTATLTNKTIDADGTGNSIINIEDANIKALAAIDATKIGTGVVDNAEFNKLNTAGTDATAEIVLTDSSQTVINKQLDGFKYGSAGIAASASVGKGNQTVIRLTGTAADLQTITGGVDGDIRVVVNESNDVIKLIDDFGANGFYTGTAADIDLQVNASVQMRYDNAVNRWKIIGGAGTGGGLTLATITANPSPAIKNTHYLTDSSGGAFSITLPAGEEGAVFRFSDITNSWSTNNVTLTPNGAETIDGQASLVLDVDGTWVQLMWDSVGGEWVVDDAIVPANLDLTGDVSVNGNLAVDNITDAAGTDFPALNGIKPTILYEKKALSTATQSSSLNPVSDLTWSGSLEIGKTYRITLQINGFVSLNTNSDLSVIIYDGDSVGGGTAILLRVHTNDGTGTGNGFFTVDTSSTIHTMTTTTLTTRFILTNASLYGNSNFNTYVIVEELPYHQSTTFV